MLDWQLGYIVAFFQIHCTIGLINYQIISVLVKHSRCSRRPGNIVILRWKELFNNGNSTSNINNLSKIQLCKIKFQFMVNLHLTSICRLVNLRLTEKWALVNPWLRDLQWLVNPRLTNFVTLVNLRLIFWVKKVKRGEVLRGVRWRLRLTPA